MIISYHALHGGLTHLKNEYHKWTIHYAEINLKMKYFILFYFILFWQKYLSFGNHSQRVPNNFLKKLKLKKCWMVWKIVSWRLKHTKNTQFSIYISILNEKESSDASFDVFYKYILQHPHYPCRCKWQTNRMLKRTPYYRYLY
jgi:hypothetical protein